ncbi:hypothetical protein RHGRI_019870 [Rhododendron griersonianum]|uniref:Uncharacterized protein n=1 Tax=Rhododendron griersonianum TaxID=479676 RepID=A0AAV6JIK8_9ERIC|nr:hypothetical protein RHGRI_019870 [Rhododendron griersonianum]
MFLIIQIKEAKMIQLDDSLHKHGVRRYAADIGVRDDVIYVPVEDMDKFHRGLVAGNSTQDEENDLRDEDESSHEDDENDLEDDEN